MGRFSGRAIVITGASSGIGRCIAVRLASSGADQWLIGRSTEGLEETARLVTAAGGPKPTCVSADISQPGKLASIVADAGVSHPHLFALINNAGVMHPEAILTGDPARWRAMFETNLLAPMEAIKVAVEAMRRHGKGGQLINISSLAARTVAYGMYSASKVALAYAGGSLRNELEGDDIRICTIVPGGFATQLSRGFTPESLEALAANASSMGIDMTGPNPRLLGDPDHIAKAVEYVLDQPLDINIEEMVVRPPVSLEL